ncbi:pantothenate transporter pant [Leuconostoc mesenteroides]|uniref:pantothenate transporter pant n=1 Tax=Leuconostoc mesenteroides TaxID=1245 RepID=UPI003886CE35
MINQKTRYFVITTLFIAIVFLQIFVPWLGLLPLGAFIVGASVTIIQFTVAIIPRVLVGLIIGYLFNKLLRNQSTAIRTVGLGVLGTTAALINTVGVVLLTTLGFTIMHTNFTGVPTHNILAWLISIVSFNALFEMIVGFILVSIIGSVLLPIAERANIIG